MDFGTGFLRTYLLYAETISKSSSKVACCRERYKKTPVHPSHSWKQGHLAWDSFYDPIEISLLFYKVVILLHMHVCYLRLVSQWFWPNKCIVAKSFNERNNEASMTWYLPIAALIIVVPKLLLQLALNFRNLCFMTIEYLLVWMRFQRILSMTTVNGKKTNIYRSTDVLKQFYWIRTLEHTKME